MIEQKHLYEIHGLITYAKNSLDKCIKDLHEIYQIKFCEIH